MSEFVSRETYPLLFEECIDGADLSKYQVGSHHKMTWKCSNPTCGHEWATEIRVRTAGHGCPVCNHNTKRGQNHNRPQKPTPGHSLGDLHPELVPMWDTEKNSFLPYDVKPKSEWVVGWICERCGKHFDRKISDQVTSHHKCPYCANGYSSSFGEQLIYYMCMQAFGTEVRNRDKQVLGFEIDVLIPSLKIGFEYGSWKWHKDRIDDDIEKIERAHQMGYRIFCIYDGNAKGNNHTIGQKGHAYYISESTSYDNFAVLSSYIQSVLQEFGKFNIDCQGCARQALVSMHDKAIPTESSLEYSYPLAVDEWDYAKNAPLVPSQIPAYSKQKHWFICEKGHSYQASPAHKTTRADGCPVCRHMVIQPGVNSFAAENPQLMPYWDWDKNKEQPDEIPPISASKEKWYWKCPHDGYEWTTQQSLGIMKKDGIINKICPACEQREALLNHISDVHFSTKGTDLFISPSLFPSGSWQHDKKYRAELEEFVRQTIIDNQNNILGNNKFSIVETSYVYIRITKDTYRTISQCYISDRPLGKKILLDKKGKAQFENITPQDDSFGAHHPEVLPYWDWDKNEKSPFDIHDNIQALKRWHWKCPDCETTWSTTRPIKNGGSASYFCRNCYLRQKLVDLLDNGKIHFYDIRADNGCRDIEPNKELMNVIEEVGRHGAGTVDMKHREIIVESDDVTVEIRKESGVIAKVIGMECPEAPWVNDK